MDNEIDKEKIQEIVTTYYEVVDNTKKALTYAGVPQRLHFFYIFMPPDFENMLPEDVVNYYRDFQKAVIIYLWRIGLSQREIARRLRGGSYALVVEALKEVKSSLKEDNGKSSNGKNNKSRSKQRKNKV